MFHQVVQKSKIRGRLTGANTLSICAPYKKTHTRADEHYTLALHFLDPPHASRIVVKLRLNAVHARADKPNWSPEAIVFQAHEVYTATSKDFNCPLVATMVVARI